mgnify:CR=1 FL=1
MVLKRNRNPEAKEDKNLIWAMVGLLAISILAAGFTAWTCGWVLESFQNSNTMAMIITDAGIKSDDKNLEHNLSTATMTLKYLRAVSYTHLTLPTKA